MCSTTLLISKPGSKLDFVHQQSLSRPFFKLAIWFFDTVNLPILLNAGKLLMYHEGFA